MGGGTVPQIEREEERKKREKKKEEKRREKKRTSGPGNRILVLLFCGMVTVCMILLRLKRA